MMSLFILFASDVRMDIMWMVMKFTLGKPHRVLGILYILILLNAFLSPYIRAEVKGFRAHFSLWIEKLIAYTSFIVIGNMIDMMAVDSMFGWQGSTQFLVCLYLAAKEIRNILTYLSNRYGIEIPILNERLGHLEQGTSEPQQNASPELTESITQLNNGIKELESDANQKDSK